MTNASAISPAPRTAPRRTSRKKPLTREAIVQPPTVSRLRSIGGSDLRFATLGAAHFMGPLPADPLCNEIERPPLYLRENPADIFAEDSERQKLNARKKRHRYDQRGETRHVDAIDQRAKQEINCE